MNITLGWSTYTKTIDLKNQDFYKSTDFDAFESNSNGFTQNPVNEPPIMQNGQMLYCSNNVSEQIISQDVPSNNFTEPRDGCAPTSVPKANLTRPTFLSKLARRLTIRRTVPKQTPFETHSGGVNSSKSPNQVPTGRKIRRWLSKHLMPPPKSSPLKTTPGTLH